MHKNKILKIINIIILVSCFASCTKEQETESNSGIEIPSNAPDETSINATILTSDSNRTKARVKFGKANKYYSINKTVISNKVQIEFYDTEMKTEATLNADSAMIDDITGNMFAYTNVVVHSLKNKTLLKADSIGYFTNNKTFKSNSKIELHDSLKFREIKGNGFESDDALLNYKIYNVSGVAGM